MGIPGRACRQPADRLMAALPFILIEFMAREPVTDPVAKLGRDTSPRAGSQQGDEL